MQLRFNPAEMRWDISRQTQDMVGLLLRLAACVDQLWSHARAVARLDTWTISTIHKALPENIPVLGVSAGYMRFHHCRTLVVLGPEIRGFGEVALMGAPDWELLMSELPGTADGAAEFDLVRYDLAVVSLVACNHQTTPQLDLYDYSCALCLYKDTEKQCGFHFDEGVPYLAAADAAGAPPP